MIGAFIGADAGERKKAISEFIARCAPSQVIYVCPKSILWQAEDLDIDAYCVPFERIEKREEWLTMNAMAGPDTALVMECVARYPKITSAKFAHLQRISQSVGHKFLTDVVPFTLGIEYIYAPYSYLSRSILGFPHWYAFREAFDEIDDRGNIVSSHDPKLIATKISRVTEWGRSALRPNRRVEVNASTSGEREKYELKKTKVFDEFVSPVKAVTALADCSHAFLSRREFTASVANELERPLVLTNLASYAAKLQPMLTTGIARSYALCASAEDIRTFSDVVYAESPIVKSYLAFDIEAQLPETASSILIGSDMKVDEFLRHRFLKEVGEINAVVNAARGVSGGA